MITARAAIALLYMEMEMGLGARSRVTAEANRLALDDGLANFDQRTVLCEVHVACEGAARVHDVDIVLLAGAACAVAEALLDEEYGSASCGH